MLDTPANRVLLLALTNDGTAKLGSDRYGNDWYEKVQPDGTQVWAQTRNGVIIDAGLNLIPNRKWPDWIEATMKESKAYKAMFHFLHERYQHLRSDALGELLGKMNLELWDDGSPADPAIVAKWERAVALAEQEDNLIGMSEQTTLRKAS